MLVFLFALFYRYTRAQMELFGIYIHITKCKCNDHFHKDLDYASPSYR